MESTIRSFVRNDTGATAIEYGLLAAGMAIAVLATLTILSDSETGVFGTLNKILVAAIAEYKV